MTRYFSLTTLSLTFIISFIPSWSCKPDDKNLAAETLPLAGKTKRALLIGINDYQFAKSLKGCVRDVYQMQKVLMEKFGFSIANMPTLLNERATRDSIISNFKKLIKVTEKDDVVVIHYSGHGSQIVDDDPSEEVDGFDETIIPYDYDDPNGALPITDDELNGLLKLLGEKTSNITLILDACHSGAGAKETGFAQERWITPDSRKQTQRADFAIAPKSKEGKVDVRNADASYVLLAGCRSDQRSYEQRLSNEIYQGAFTRALVAQLEKATPTTTWSDVMENVKVAVNKLFSNQSPQLEGPASESYLFGDRFEFDGDYILVSPKSAGVVSVDAGIVLGLTVGSRFDVFPPATKDFSGKPVASIEITKTDEFKAEGKILSGSVAGTNSRARESFHNYEHKPMNVAFVGDWNKNYKNLKTQIGKIPGVIENQAAPDIVLRLKKTTAVVSLADDTTKVLNKFNVASPAFAGQLTERVKEWRKWHHVLTIHNPNPGIKFDISLALGQRDLKSIRPDFECVAGDLLELTIKNNSKIPVFINILDLDDEGGISAYTLSQFDDPESSANEPIAAGKTVTVTLEASTREPVEKPGKNKIHYNRDVLKIFATATDIRFDFLEQEIDSDVKKMINPTTKDLKPPSKETTKLGTWNAKEKVILVTAKQ